MKKVLFAILIACMSFGFIQQVDAKLVDYGAKTCVYTGMTDDNQEFKIAMQMARHPLGMSADTYVNILIQPLDEQITVFGKTKKFNDHWTQWNVKVKNNDKFVKPHELPDYGSDLITGDCYNYLYWKGNDWYLSNERNEQLNGQVKQLSLLPNYQKTSSNAILKELQCTYSNSSPNTSGTGPFTIIYKLKPKDDGFSYQILKEDFVDGKFVTWYDGSVSSWYGTQDEYKDLLNSRVFWSEANKSYGCPSMIEVGVGYHESASLLPFTIDKKTVIGFPTLELEGELDEELLKGLKEIMAALETSEYRGTYTLQNKASYIDYEVASEENGPLCSYGLSDLMTEEGKKDHWYYAIQEVKPNSGTNYFSVIANDKMKDVNLIIPSRANVVITKGKLSNSCEDLPEIYTNCIGNEGKSCIISDTKESFNYDSNVKTLVQNKIINNIDQSTLESALGINNGFKYKRLIYDLSERLKGYKTLSELNNPRLAPIHIYTTDGSKIAGSEIAYESYSIYQIVSDPSICQNWDIKTNYNCDSEECKKNLAYDTEQYLKKISTYCSTEHYSKLTSQRLQNSMYKARMDECVQFYHFYSSLVNEGIVSNLGEGCDLLSGDMVKILQRVLNLFRIAAPIVALGLGTLDFIKVIAAGDADKEMKTAGKRLFTRIAAAILLIIIPTILAFLLDTFLGEKEGYNKDNPFCNIVDWNELK